MYVPTLLITEYIFIHTVNYIINSKLHNNGNKFEYIGVTSVRMKW